VLAHGTGCVVVRKLARLFVETSDVLSFLLALVIMGAVGYGVGLLFDVVVPIHDFIILSWIPLTTTGSVLLTLLLWWS
jgi:hypothetical protein